MLNHLGWQSHDGTPIDSYDLYWLPVIDVLGNVSTTRPDGSQRWQIVAEGIAARVAGSDSNAQAGEPAIAPLLRAGELTGEQDAIGQLVHVRGG